MTTRRFWRAAAIIACLVIAAPVGAHATTDTITAPFPSARAWKTASQTPLRGTASSTAEAARSGAVSLSAAVSGKLGSSVPFASATYAYGQGTIDALHTVPEGAGQVTYIARILVNSATLYDGGKPVDVWGGGAAVGLRLFADCDCNSSWTDGVWYSTTDGDAQIEDQEVELTVTVYDWYSSGSHVVDLEVSFFADATTGIRAGEWSASLDATLLSISATY